MRGRIAITLAAASIAFTIPTQAQTTSMTCVEARKSIDDFLNDGESRDFVRSALGTISEAMDKEGRSDETCAQMMEHVHRIFEVEDKSRTRDARFAALKAIDTDDSQNPGAVPTGSKTSFDGQKANVVPKATGDSEDGSAARTDDAATDDSANASENMAKADAATTDNSATPALAADVSGDEMVAGGEQETVSVQADGSGDDRDAGKNVENESGTVAESAGDDLTSASNEQTDDARNSDEKAGETDEKTVSAGGGMEAEAVEAAEDVSGDETADENSLETAESADPADSTGKSGDAAQSTVSNTSSAEATDNGNAEEKTTKSAETETPARQSSPLDGRTVESVVGRYVVGANGEDLGSVDSVVIRNGIPYVIVSHGGFLSIGETEVGVKAERFSLSDDGETLVLPQLTENEFDSMADWDEDEFPEADDAMMIGDLYEG